MRDVFSSFVVASLMLGAVAITLLSAENSALQHRVGLLERLILGSAVRTQDEDSMRTVRGVARVRRGAYR